MIKENKYIHSTYSLKEGLNSMEYINCQDANFRVYVEMEKMFN